MPKASRVGKFRKTAAHQLALPTTSSSSSTTIAKPATQRLAPVSDSAPIVAKTDSTSNDAPAGRGHQQLSRGQRKRLAKREQYLRKERMVMSSLKLKREEEQKKRIDGLDAIKEALMATVTAADDKKGFMEEQKPRSMLRTNRGKKKLLEKESAQMNLVLQHPRFQADPFATIQEHLKNILEKDAEKRKKEEVEHAKHLKKAAEQKKALKKEQGIKRRRKKKFKAARSKAR
jgi:hypothetical protein